MKIEITMEIEDELADENDDTGLTADAYTTIFDALSAYGSDIDIAKVEA